jgi:hypothetical protein
MEATAPDKSVMSHPSEAPGSDQTNAARVILGGFLVFCAVDVIHLAYSGTQLIVFLWGHVLNGGTTTEAVIAYDDKDGFEPFMAWLYGLRDAVGRKSVFWGGFGRTI